MSDRVFGYTIMGDISTKVDTHAKLYENQANDM